MYKDLDMNDVAKQDEQISRYWEEIDLLRSSIDSRSEAPDFIFYEGPPTSNGKPGVHHVISRALKDGVCRYKTMKGFKVNRKAGWDTHGLPVEIEVEKQLGLGGKQEIEEYGIEAFNKKCRESVFTYGAMWKEMTAKMGYLIDLENPYITLDNHFIETEWYILKEFFKAGLIYEGHKILPYCSRCGTGLASHEVAQGYKEIKSNTVYVKFKASDEDAYYLVWTTTPWTLASNVALTVNPDENYVKIDVEGEHYYIQEHLAGKLFDEYKVLKTFKGKELEYRKYEQLIPFVKPDKEAFYVTCADYVTVEDGTGIVHTAPAFGEDDYQTGKRYNLPVLQPVNEEGLYTDTIWAGKHVLDKDLELEIITWLYNEGKLLKKQAMMHNYPHCWRCSTPLLYYAKPSWYIEMTKLKDNLVANNKEVKWHPEFVGEKRFGNWLENVNDWAISRSRYWGTPLNIWRCDECGHIDSIGSRQELMDRAIEEIDLDIDMHRPHVDRVTIVCEKCSGHMHRVPDVIDCWFDSGSMPFAQWHYPFEHKEEFEQLFPADFICEGIDQTRGWFYSLIAISTFLMGRAPYKNVLVNDLILDKDGKKMSKSKGNVVDPFMLLDNYGADALRWYIYYNSPVWEPTKFDEKGVKEIGLKFFSTLKNVYSFFVMYANADELNVAEFDIPYEKRAEIDRWLLSKLNKLISEVDADMDEFDLNKAVRKIHEFVMEDLSNWYIRRNRRRFWASETDDDKKSVYLTTYEVLVDLCKIIAPFAPFGVERMYQNLTGEKSVHIAYFPQVKRELIDDHVEKRMDLVRELVSIGRAARESVKIKVRQPLSKVIIDGRHKDLIFDLQDLLKEELNVKEVVFEDHLENYMNFSLKPNFPAVGKILGKKMGAYSKALSDLDQSLWATKLKAGEVLTLHLDDEEFRFTEEHVQINISAKDSFTVDMKNNLFVILDTHLDKNLICEGYVREFISKIQQMRKSLNFNVLDKIHVEYEAEQAIQDAVCEFKEYISQETLATSIDHKELDCEEFDINGSIVKLSIKKE